MSRKDKIRKKLRNLRKDRNSVKPELSFWEKLYLDLSSLSKEEQSVILDKLKKEMGFL